MPAGGFQGVDRGRVLPEGACRQLVGLLDGAQERSRARQGLHERAGLFRG